jgi:diacylglycerol kinase (ATP)
MKIAKLLHNPNAGDGVHSAENIAALIEAAGYGCTHQSTKAPDGPEISREDVDFVVLAGGDGTVRKMAKHLLRENLPIGLLPMGTANNIAKTLAIPDDTNEIIKGWKNGNTRPFDIGRVYGLGKRRFFLEGVGFGVFPRLMREMRRQKKENIENPDKKLKTAVELLHDVVQTYRGRFCSLQIDGIDHSGNFLLVEVMNTKSIGPNLNLAPFASPADGLFEVVLIPEERRNDFLKYLETKAEGNERIPFFHTISADRITMKWKGRMMHIDDETVRLDKSTHIEIVLQKGALKFLV